MAAVFTVSIPIPVFNNGRAAIAQATAQRTQADAQRRVTALDIEQAITDAQAQAANAATTAARTSVVWGKSVSGRVDLAGRRSIQNTTTPSHRQPHQTRT